MDLRAIAITALMTAAPLSALAGVNTWTPVGPEGGEVRKVVYDRNTPTTVYMIAAAGFLRSQDEGATWQLVKSDFFNAPSDLDVDPTLPNRLYVVSASTPTLQMSTDGGATFKPVSGFPNVGSISQLEVGADGTTLYAASGLQILRSTSRGATWEMRAPLGSGTGVTWRLLADPSDATTLYAIVSGSGASNSLLVTHDGALSWAPLPAAATKAGYLRDIAIHGANTSRLWIAGDNGVFVSSDSGTNFSPDSPAGAVGISSIAINPADATNLVVADSYGHVYQTTNEGATWTEITGDVTAGSAMTVAIAPSQPFPHILVGGLGGLSLNTSGGNVWIPRQTGFIGSRVGSLSADATSDRLYMSGSTGVYYVGGGGSTTTATNNSQLRGLAVSPTSLYVPAMLAQDGAPGRLFASLDNQIARSLDGGNTWTLTGFTLAPGHQVRSLTHSPSNPQVILGGGPSSLYRSADGGDTWVSSVTGLPAGAFVEHVEFAPSDALIAYATPQTFSAGTGQSFGLYRSSDAGQSWSPANTGTANLAVVALAVDPTNAQTVYVSGDSKIWRSTDGGGSWTELPWQSQAWGYPSALAVDPLHPQIIYATGLAVVARSINRGNSWELLREAQDLPLWVPSVMLPDPKRPHVLLVGTQNSGAQQITIAPDLTLALDPIADPLPVNTAVSYHYTVANVGPFHATGVKLTLDMPTSARDVTVVPSVGACTTSGQKITCSLTDIRAGFNATVTLNATLSQVGAFHVGASVQGDQPDALASNNVQNRDAVVAQLSDVLVRATGPASARIGDALTYALTVSNAGPQAASGVQLTYQLGSGLTAGTVSTDTGSCGVASGVVTCGVGTLAVGASVKISVNATAASAGDQSSTATVTVTSTDTVAGNGTAAVVTTVTAAPAAGSGGGGSGGGGGGSSGGGGGGGLLSPVWLLVLGLILVAKIRGDARRKAVVG